MEPLSVCLYVSLRRWAGCTVLYGDPAPLPKKGVEPPSPPQFSAHVYCGQTAGWIKMALDMEVDLDTGHILLDGEPAPFPQKGGRAPNFWAMSIVAKRLDASRCRFVRRQTSAQATVC